MTVSTSTSAVALGDLSKKLDEQFLETVRKEFGEKVTSREYEISELGVNAIVEMVRISREPVQLPTGIVICGGGKDCRDIAKVTMTPEDEKVQEVISAYLCQTLPGPMGGQVYKFDEITIGEQRIR